MDIVVDFRSHGRISDGSLVVGINLSIPVHILILDVARTRGAAQKLWLGSIDVCLVLEEADSLVAEELAYAMTGAYQVRIELRSLILLLDLAAIVIEVGTDVKLHVANLLVVVETCLPTPAVHDTIALVWSIHTQL